MTWMAIASAAVPVPLWIVLLVCAGIGAVAVFTIWLASVIYIGWQDYRRKNRRPILDKMEVPLIDETRSSALADMERRYKSDKRAAEES